MLSHILRQQGSGQAKMLAVGDMYEGEQEVFNFKKHSCVIRIYELRLKRFANKSKTGLLINLHKFHFDKCSMAKHERPRNNFSWIILLIILASDTYMHLNAQQFSLDQYLGCFDDNETRVSFDGNQTVEGCIQYCKLKEMQQSYAKLQNGSHCECVNKYGLQVKDSLCNIKYEGNPFQHFGGPNSSFSSYVLYAVCPIGFYGSQCNTPCHCKRQMPCDRQTGNCSNGCHGSYTGASCNKTNLDSGQYIGCYRDINDNRTMEGGQVNYDKTNSLQTCSERCSSENYSYTGTQFASECFCGESYDKHGTRNKSDCNKPCTGNGQESCGGANAISVYHTCPTGFYGPYCSKVCNCETDRCAVRNGMCHPHVKCKSGWRGAACNLRDCSMDSGGCDLDELCVSVEPIVSKQISVCRRCPKGFERKNEANNLCTDIDECTDIQKTCGSNAIECNNIKGGYLCHCRDKTIIKDTSCRPDELKKQHIGCFYENGATGNKAVMEVPRNGSVTVKNCLDFCRNTTSTYARLLNETYCDCVDENYGIKNESLCNETCVDFSDLSCTGRSDVRAYIVYTVCPNGTYGLGCDQKCYHFPCDRLTGECQNKPCGQSDSSFIQFIKLYLEYVAPPLVAVVILVPIVICHCRRSRNQKGKDFQTKRAKIAAFLSTEITKKKRKPPAMPDIEACEKRTPASISNSIGDLTIANSEISKEKDQTALIKKADTDQHKRNPKKRLKIPSPDDCDFKDQVTLSKQPEKDKTKGKTKKPIIPDPDQCAKIQPEHEKTKRKSKKCINPDPKVSEEKDQNESGKSEDEKVQRKVKKRALPVPKGQEEKEHPELGKSADEKTKKTKKFAGLNSEKSEEKEQGSTKGSTRKSNLYILAERRTANKPALPIARETKMNPKQSKPTNEYELKSRPTPDKSADDDSDGEVYAGLEDTADNGEGDVYTALETGNAANCSNTSMPSQKPRRK